MVHLNKRAQHLVFILREISPRNPETGNKTYFCDSTSRSGFQPPVSNIRVLRYLSSIILFIAECDPAFSLQIYNPLGNPTALNVAV
jgi:hypothetical protein